jgi:DNA topoisomerase-1
MPTFTLTKKLVIVESPAKCKKIEQYLGPSYKCLASFGHLRELSSLQNIDENFECKYNIIDNSIKRKQIELLRKAIQESDEVILATDDDREGEAIAWHICQLFKLPIEKTERIIFHEVTESALQKAIMHPKKINMNIVEAQQTRQILDLLVGFRVTPILWKCISAQSKKPLSAGRCQTPALKIIYDNHLAIQNTEEKKVYKTTGYFTNLSIPFELNKELSEVVDFLDKTADFEHMYSVSLPRQVKKASPEPFTTSRLQQSASNELHFSPKETMSVCQTLYEAGYITYMRTDSKKYSPEFLDTVKKFVLRTYDESYLHVDSLTNTETAHEAIRPTNILVKELSEMDNKEKRMYRMIWENSLESCMSSAIYFSITAEITSPENCAYHYTSEQIHFPGWQIVKNKFQKEKEDKYSYLQNIKNGSIPYQKVVSKITINTKSHYTEARLVQLLEEKGIGRPSTFSMLVDKIQEREYVKKQDIKGKTITCLDYELEKGEISEIESKREFGNEKGKLVIQPLGIIVMHFLEKHFHSLFHYEYTKEMEDALDKISGGEECREKLCRGCNYQITELIDSISTSKQEYKIDENHRYIVGKYGPVIKCTETNTFIPASRDLDMNKLENGEYRLEEITKPKAESVNPDVLGMYEGQVVTIKKGKFGLYVTWGTNSKTLKEFGNRPPESIAFEEVEPFLQEGSNILRKVSENISIRKSKKGNYIYFKTDKMKKPQFFDVQKFYDDCLTCELCILSGWIKEKYNIF